VLAVALIGAVAVHVAGVLMETRGFGHPLVRAMADGRKPAHPRKAELRGPLALRGLAVAVLALGVLGAAGWALASSGNPRWHALAGRADHAAYTKACGECHHAHHPSLRTADGWRGLMGGLGAHFGEDASLAPDTEARITAFLAANAAETFDTKAANRIGRTDPAVGRITETRFWKRRHRDLDAALFKRPDVGSAANCNACHRDAATGRFDGQAIHVPDGDKT
jgi:hypothetical protein